MLPTFVDTVSQRFCYHFYIAYDYNDPVLMHPEGRNAFVHSFAKVFNETATVSEIDELDLTFVKCNHTRSPAWAQNDALMTGYHAGATYLYMINDDTRFLSWHWPQYLTQALAKMNPKNVGISGPNHIHGNTKVLTYNFVHRTHVDIFGYFYPREFVDWGADVWISEVYQPDNYAKLVQVAVNHVMNLGTRYEPTLDYTKLYATLLSRGRDRDRGCSARCP